MTYSFKAYKNNSVFNFFLHQQWIILSWHNQSTNIIFEHSCKKYDWIFRDTNKKIPRGKGYLCNSLISHSKIFYKHDHNQHANELSSDSGRQKYGENIWTRLPRFSEEHYEKKINSSEDRSHKTTRKNFKIATLVIDICLWKIYNFKWHFTEEIFVTIEYMTDRTKESILRCIGNVVSLYNKIGFKIETILADPEFGPYTD